MYIADDGRIESTLIADWKESVKLALSSSLQMANTGSEFCANKSSKIADKIAMFQKSSTSIGISSQLTPPATPPPASPVQKESQSKKQLSPTTTVSEMIIESAQIELICQRETKSILVSKTELTPTVCLVSLPSHVPCGKITATECPQNLVVSTVETGASEYSNVRSSPAAVALAFEEAIKKNSSKANLSSKSTNPIPISTVTSMSSKSTKTAPDVVHSTIAPPPRSSTKALATAIATSSQTKASATALSYSSKTPVSTSLPESTASTSVKPSSGMSVKEIVTSLSSKSQSRRSSNINSSATAASSSTADLTVVTGTADLNNTADIVTPSLQFNPQHTQQTAPINSIDLSAQSPAKPSLIIPALSSSPSQSIGGPAAFITATLSKVNSNADPVDSIGASSIVSKLASTPTTLIKLARPYKHISAMPNVLPGQSAASRSEYTTSQSHNPESLAPKTPLNPVLTPVQLTPTRLAMVTVPIGSNIDYNSLHSDDVHVPSPVSPIINPASPTMDVLSTEAGAIIVEEALRDSCPSLTTSAREFTDNVLLPESERTGNAGRIGSTCCDVNSSPSRLTLDFKNKLNGLVGSGALGGLGGVLQRDMRPSAVGLVGTITLPNSRPNSGRAAALPHCDMITNASFRECARSTLSGRGDRISRVSQVSSSSHGGSIGGSFCYTDCDFSTDSPRDESDNPLKHVSSLFH